MQIIGFTIIKNGIKNDYPFVEAITSVLPLVDKMIVLAGDSDDDTDQSVRDIGSQKIELHKSVWDPSIREGGRILAVETDKAFDLVPTEADWAFYIQADEVIHEKFYESIYQAALKYKDDPRVEGLVFKYLHFYGTYDYVGDSRQWYNREVRLIRNDKNIRSYKDAQGFRRKGKKLKVKPVNATVYHYGYVKSPHQMLQKQKNTVQYWSDQERWKVALDKAEVFDFSNFDSLEKFTGTHPNVMMPRIATHNWKVDLDIGKKKFSLKDRLLYWFEKRTGIRLFDFKNYRII